MRRTLATALALALLAGPLAPAAGASRVDDKIKAQQNKIHNLHEKLNEKKGELAGAKRKVQTLQEYVDQTNHSIAIVSGNLAVLRSQQHTNEKNLAWNKVQVGAAQATLARHSEALKKRLVDAYEHGDLGYLEVMLEAKSFSDFVERWNAIRYVIKSTQSTIRQRKVDEHKVRQVQANLLSAEAQLAHSQAAAEQEQRALDVLADQRRSLLSSAEAQKGQIAKEVADLDEVSAAQSQALGELIRQKQAEEAARREAARRAAQLAGQAVSPVENAPGILSWPVSGPITSPFGIRNHPVLGVIRPHEGIDIGASTGTTIAAPAGGKVIIAGWSDGGYGNMVTIDHGGGMSTVYGHLSQIFVSTDQTVQKGQALGAVGMTGLANGPHLHFEVRINGNPVDPMGYLR